VPTGPRNKALTPAAPPVMPIPSSGAHTGQFANPQPPQVPPGQPWPQQIAAHLPVRDATPTAQDTFDRPMYTHRPSQMPQVAGFGRPKRPALQPWMLVVGAIVMAALAFAITRMFIR
jgi:hypothetical protein